MMGWLTANICGLVLWKEIGEKGLHTWGEDHCEDFIVSAKEYNGVIKSWKECVLARLHDTGNQLVEMEACITFTSRACNKGH